MKMIIFSLAISGLLFTPKAHAKVDFVSTLITCQQGEGDDWIEVGIVESGDELKAMTVRNNVETHTATLIDTRVVHEVAGARGRAYVDSTSFGLVIQTSKKDLTASLMVSTGVKQPISERNLDCIENSDLRFDAK
jgi:hypothetical protein